MKHLKKVLAFVLCIMMLFGCVPVGTFGEIDFSKLFSVDAEAAFYAKYDLKIVDANGNPVRGAIATIYSGSDVVWTSKPSNSEGGIQLEGFDVSKNKKATISAHLDTGNGLELCSETVNEKGVWEGEKVQELLKKSAPELKVDEPRWHIELSVAYEGERERFVSVGYDVGFVDMSESIEKLMSEYSGELAQMTNGHVLLDDYQVVHCPDEGELYVEDEEKNVLKDCPYDILIFNDGRGACATINGFNTGEGHIFCSFEKVTPQTLAHESGHYLFGFWDEYCYGKMYRYDTHGADGSLGGDGLVCDFDEGCGHKGTKADPHTDIEGSGKWGHGYVSKPITGNFGVMDHEHEGIEMSTDRTYSYLSERYGEKMNPPITPYEADHNPDIYTMQYYMNGMSCETNLAAFLDDLCIGYPTAYSNTNGVPQTAKYPYAVLAKSDANDNQTKIISLEEQYPEIAASTDVTEQLVDIRYSISDEKLIVESVGVENIAYYLKWVCAESIEKINSFPVEIPLEKLVGEKIMLYAVKTEGDKCTKNITSLRAVKSLDTEQLKIHNDSDEYVVIVSTKSDDFGPDYSLVGTEYQLISASDNFGGYIDSALPAYQSINYDSVGWARFSNDNKEELASNLFVGEHNISHVSAYFSGPGKYALITAKASDKKPDSVSDIVVSNENCLYDNQVSLSFNDGNTDTYQYNLYYSTRIDYLNNDGKFTECVSFPADSESFILNLNEGYGNYIFGVQAVSKGGALSEIVTAEEKVAEKDSNNDGIPDSWFDEYYMLEDSSTIAAEDSDYDGISNLEEYRSGTNPLDNDSIIEHFTVDEQVYDITDVVVAEELFDGFSAELMGAVADAMFNMKDSVDVSSYEITTDDLVALFSAIAKYYPSEYSLMSKTNFSYRASVSPSLGIVTKLRFFYDEDVNLSDFQRRVKELDAAIQKIVADCEGMSDFEKLLYVHDYILLHAEYDLELLELMETQGSLDGETHSERYSEYSILVNGTGICGSYALAYRAVLNAMGINCLYLSSDQMNHAWNLVKLNGNWYHVDVCWDDPVPDSYGRADREYFLLTDTEIMARSHYSWTPGQYKATDTSFSDMPRDYDISQKMDNGNWYYSDFGSLYKADIYGKNEEEICALSASTFDVDNGEIYFASGKYIYHHTDAGNSLVYVIPGNKLGSEPKRAYITNLYINGNNAEYYKYIVDESGSGKIVNEKAEIGKEAYAGISGVCLNSNESTVSIFDTLQLTATATDGKSVAAYDCEWRSSNSNVASVSATGLVMARNVGTATVTFSALGFSAVCRVTVTGDGLSGSCGENAVWEFDPETGTLTFSGDGEINTNTWSKCAGAVKKMVIKDDVYFSESILNGFSAFTSLETFDVSFWNDYYKDDSSAALLSKDKTELIKYAPANEAVYYEIPDGVIKIRANALYGSENLQALVIPESVETVQTGSFSGCNNVKYLLLECGKTAAAAITPRFVNLKRVYVGDNSVDSLYLNNANRITVYAEDSAQIKSYCSENGIKFVSTDTNNHAHGYYPKEFVDFTDEKDGEIKWYSFCGDDHYTETVHNYDEGEIIPATCISCEKIKRTCKNCGHVDISNAVENDYEVGDIIEFGSYPQSEVKDNALKAQIESRLGKWHSYEYMSGNGSIGSMVPSDYMKYQDVSLGSEKYRAVTFEAYRPSSTELIGSSDSSQQDDNGYSCGEIYYFKWENLRWTVIDPQSGYVICESIIDSQPFNNYCFHDSGYWSDTSKTIYVGDYEESYVRHWLINDFYTTAFKSSQQNKILYEGYNLLNPTVVDKVLLPPDADLIYDVALSKTSKGTDYAKCQGLYTSGNESDDGSVFWTGNSYHEEVLNGTLVFKNNYYAVNSMSDTSIGVRPSLYLDFSKLNSYEVGDIIEFGSYPQSEVKDEALKELLASKLDKWKSYSYVSGDGKFGSTKPFDYMKYQDISLDSGEKYRAVTFDTYRPKDIAKATSTSCDTYQDDNGYRYEEIYYFKWEKLCWRVLDPQKGLVICDSIIDSQAYTNYVVYDSSGLSFNTNSYYASDYEVSTIRRWLTGSSSSSFLNTAFSQNEKEKIVATELNNDGDNTLKGIADTKEFDSASKKDKVFLLSYDEALNGAYGFSEEQKEYDSARQAKGTDYAKCQGLKVETGKGNCSDWLLRSQTVIALFSYVVSADGGVSIALVADCSIGVRPAMCIELNAQKNNYQKGDIIELGSYPQSKVENKELIANLQSKLGEWTSYEYVSGSSIDNSITTSDFMKYQDIVIENGDKYRAVLFDKYRESTIYQNKNGYQCGEIYYFKWETLYWRVLDPQKGLVLCENSIDSQAFNNYDYKEDPELLGESYSDVSCTNFASDYATSSIRSWLTSPSSNSFINIAFSENEKKRIFETKLNNDGYKTLIGEKGYEIYDSESTTDCIFLLSYDEAIFYGEAIPDDVPYFLSQIIDSDFEWNRRARGTDYAKCQGLGVYESEGSGYNGCSKWLLRTPSDGSEHSCGVSVNGCVTGQSYTPEYCGSCITGSSSSGIRPAMCLNLLSFNSSSVGPHSPAEPITENFTDSTCKDHGGYDEVTYCSLCGEELIRKHVSLPLSKHHSFEITETVAPTCTGDGYEKLVCSVCGEERTRTLSSVFAHDFVETVVAPTCTQNGYTKAECTLCGEVEFYDFTPPIGHKLTITNEGEYCEAHGTKCYKCSRCDYEEAVAVSSEKLVTQTVRTEPTCTQAGSEKEICTLCGATIATVILKPTGHVFADNFTVDKAASCTETGEKSRHCANCEERIYITEIPLAAHSFKDEVIVSSCTKQGYTKHSCRNCEYSYCDGYTEIDPAAHTVVTDEAVAPTCTQTGLTAGCHCSECGITIVEQQVVNPTGHTAGEWEYEGNGYFIQKCDVCHETADSKQVSICFNVDSVSIANRGVKVLKPTVTDDFTSDYSFSSSDDSVATVDADGLLTAKSVGKCDITVTINGTDISDTVPVTVNAREFKLTFVIDGKEQTAEVKEGTPIKAPEVTVKPGFEFTKWTPEVPAVMPGENVVYYAEILPKHFTVDILVDGEKIGETEYTYGDTELDLSEFTVPEKPGYDGKWDYTLTPEGAEVIAVYTPITYKATFVAEGKTVGTVDYTVETKSITEPDVPAKAGYTGKWSDYTLAVGGVTINAVYTPITYTATFVAEGKTVGTVDYTVETKSITEPDVPVKAGYTGKWSDYTLAVGGVTINAIYNPKHFTVDILVDGEKIGETEYTYGDTELDLSEFTVPEKPGYDGKWDYTLTPEGAEVVAVYTPITYKATFVADEKTVGTVDYTVETKSITEPDVPAKAGYTGKWSDYTLAIGGVTVHAVYTNASVITIMNYVPERTEDYKATVTFRAKYGELPEGAVIKWYRNGKEIGTGDSVTVKEDTTGYVVECRVFVNGEKVASSPMETVRIKHKFFDKFIALFRKLFKSLPVITQ